MSSIKISDLIPLLEKLAPEELAEDYDNVGLLVGERDATVDGILTSLDITIPVLQEALEKKLNLIISHHPIWFQPRRSLKGDDFPSEVILFAVRNRLSLFACHTNLDNSKLGINQAIADKLGLQDTKFLLPSNRVKYKAGSGMIGLLPSTMSAESFLQLTKEVFGCHCIRYSRSHPNKIDRVAVCGGAGGFLLQDALRQNADAYLTSDIKYHQFFDSQGRLLYLDIGHYESEQFSGMMIAEYLKQDIHSITIEPSQSHTNPVAYYINSSQF